VQNLISIPDDIDFVRAAAFPLTFLTAWHMLMTKAKLERGEDVLVLAAGSGVGQAAIQIAILHGARVFATAGSDAKVERARASGAYEVIHHHKQDVAAEILRLTNRRGVDVVIEHVGDATWTKSVRSLARGGRLVTCGATTGPQVGLDLRVLFAKQLSLLGAYVGTKGELLRAARFFFAGQLAPVIDRLTTANPDINVEVNIDGGLVDIVADRYDAGVRLGERLEQDMIAVPISPKLRMAAFGSPAYFSARGTPETPYDLANHSCINLRFPGSGGLYAWEFERDGKELKVRAEGQLVFNDVDLIMTAALAGHGIAFMLEDHATEHLAGGRLVRVLEDWCEPFDGYYLYYPSRRQPSPAFSLVLEALRYRA